jgi:SAM-dependent methyltransferase
MIRLFALPLSLAALAAGAGVYAAQAPLAGRGAPAGDFPAAARPVAPIVSPTWGDSASRDQAREVAQIAGYLHLHPSDTVADIGAGQGYDTLRLARLLFRGRVIAEDVDPSALQTLQAEAQRRQLANVTIALGEPQDPRLPARSLDAAILVHMYHEIAHPYAFLYNLSAALKPGARVGVEELDRPTAAHGTPPALLRCEFAAVGYRAVESRPLQGGLGYFAVFAAPAQPPEPQRIHACRA